MPDFKDFLSCRPDRAAVLNLLRSGTVVHQPRRRSEDLDFYVTDDDGPDEDRLADRVWIEVDVPIPWFGCQFQPKELGPSHNPADPRQAAHEREREDAIRRWVAGAGGWLKALNASPVLATFDKHVNFLDGWHRAKLAHAAGHATVRTVVGVRPDVYAREIRG